TSFGTPPTGMPGELSLSYCRADKFRYPLSSPPLVREPGLSTTFANHWVGRPRSPNSHMVISTVENVRRLVDARDSRIAPVHAQFADYLNKRCLDRDRQQFGAIQMLVCPCFSRH